MYEATENVAIDFPSPIDLASFSGALSVVPPAATHVSLQAYGKRAVVQLRKTPGTTYALHVAAGVRALDGSVTAQPIDVTVKTADDPVPAPLRTTPNEPYRYGVLAHPYPASLGGPDAGKIVDLLADAGVRFVRIDYAGDQIEHVRGTFDFSIEDRIAGRLAARGITELPIVLQYSAPGWATGGAKYPAIWSDPQDYAQFAGAVAAHLAAHYPRITRVELLNEPNLDGWWKNPANPRLRRNRRFGNGAVSASSVRRRSKRRRRRSRSPVRRSHRAATAPIRARSSNISTLRAANAAPAGTSFRCTNYRWGKSDVSGAGELRQTASISTRRFSRSRPRTATPART